MGRKAVAMLDLLANIMDLTISVHLKMLICPVMLGVNEGSASVL